MDGTIALRGTQRKVLLEQYRRNPDPAVRLRAHIVLLLATGYPWSLICATLFCSSRTVARWKHRFERGGIEALLDETRGRRSGYGRWIMGLVVTWVTHRTPREFGFLRSRWCCATVVVLLMEVCHLRVSPETVRRWLHGGGVVWRRPRPVLRPKDPQRSEKLRQLRILLANLADDEIAVFQDEVDIQTNPKIGAMWMLRGHQAHVETPGTNQKRYLAGSLNWRTGDVIATEGQGRNSALFVRHLEDLRQRLRRYRKIHVICDNAIFHDPRRCGRVRQYLAQWGHRIELHFLPKYDPASNPIERVWWHLHEEITRNHRCQSLDELLDLVFEWLDQRRPFAVERHVYQPRRAA